MSFPNVFRAPHVLLAAGLLVAPQVFAQRSAPGPDFSGIWQLNDKQSDSADVIMHRLHAEKRREQAPSARPASASSSGTPASSSNSGFGGHGGGRGMGGGMGGMGGGGMGGGHGRHGGQGTQSSSSGSSAPVKDPTPPLFANDNFLNVQQSSEGLRADFNNTDRLDTRFDGVTRPSLNGTAQVQTQLTRSGMQITMVFDDGTQLNQMWVRSADGHHLTVTESWKTNDLKEPILFTRSYDRLDL